MRGSPTLYRYAWTLALIPFWTTADVLAQYACGFLLSLWPGRYRVELHELAVDFVPCGAILILFWLIWRKTFPPQKFSAALPWLVAIVAGPTILLMLQQVRTLPVYRPHTVAPLLTGFAIVHLTWMRRR